MRISSPKNSKTHAGVQDTPFRSRAVRYLHRSKPNKNWLAAEHQHRPPTSQVNKSPLR
jgi:hypothetical protein